MFQVGFRLRFDVESLAITVVIGFSFVLCVYVLGGMGGRASLPQKLLWELQHVGWMCISLVAARVGEGVNKSLSVLASHRGGAVTFCTFCSILEDEIVMLCSCACTLRLSYVGS